MKITILVLIVFLCYIILFELAGRNAFGKFLSDEEILPFLEKHLKEYQVNDSSWRDGNKMLWNIDLPYIARTPLISFFARWYIQDYGRIPKSSKADKIITDYFNLLPKPPKRSLLKDL